MLEVIQLDNTNSSSFIIERIDNIFIRILPHNQLLVPGRLYFKVDQSLF
jgi:hypothetical protein